MKTPASKPSPRSRAKLVEKRDAWLNPPDASTEELKHRTLTNLYNARPAWLANAHRKLDEAVFAAYGWPSTLTDPESWGAPAGFEPPARKSQKTMPSAG